MADPFPDEKPRYKLPDDATQTMNFPTLSENSEREQNIYPESRYIEG